MADRRRRRRRLQRYWNTPSKRVIRDRLNSLEAYTDDELFERYRFRQEVYLLNLIGGTLLESTRNNALPPMLQLFVCLRFFATGAYHKLIGDSLNVSESTADRCCRSITEAILHVRKQFIVFSERWWSPENKATIHQNCRYVISRIVLFSTFSFKKG